MSRRRDGGFTLVEVLVALVVVAIGLAALMTTVSGTARTSGYLRDKVLAQWIAMNRLVEVRLTVNKLANGTATAPISTLSSSSTGTAPISTSSLTNSSDTGELRFGGRTWHYDTRYFDTTFPSTKRIVVRVWAGDAKTKGNPLAEATGFYGADLSVPGNSNALDWTSGTTVAAPCQAPGSPLVGGGFTSSANGMANCNPTGTTPVGTTPGVAPSATTIP